MTRRGLSPIQLAHLALGSAYLASSGWLITRLPLAIWSSSTHLRVWVFIVPAIAGVAFTWWAESHLKHTFINGSWTEDHFEKVRQFLSMPVWNWVNAAAAVGFIGYICFSSRGLSAGASIYVFLFPLGTAQRMLQAITPRPQSTGGQRDWKSFKPLHSEHWGEPAKHGGEPLPS